MGHDLLEQLERGVVDLLVADADQRIGGEGVFDGLLAQARVGVSRVCHGLLLQRLPISMHKTSAITAGLASLSISSLQSSLSSTRPPSCGCAEIRATRARTRAPAFTGERKRTLSRPQFRPVEASGGMTPISISMAASSDSVR